MCFIQLTRMHRREKTKNNHTMLSDLTRVELTFIVPDIIQTQPAVLHRTVHPSWCGTTAVLGVEGQRGPVWLEGTLWYVLESLHSPRNETEWWVIEPSYSNNVIWIRLSIVGIIYIIIIWHNYGNNRQSNPVNQWRIQGGGQEAPPPLPYLRQIP